MNIDVKDLGVTIDGKQIIQDIQLSVQSSQFVGIIGPNGSGKSTLLKCIYRTLHPDVGTIYLDQKPLDTYKTKDSAKKLSVVAQHNYYNFDFLVEEVVLMGRAPHKRALDNDTPEDYEIVRQALQRVDLLSYAQRSFSTLSGGEQQRVILARALAQQTPCLILDEPTNHLDIKHQLDLLKLVRNLDCTVVAAIHDLNMAAHYCDKIYALKNGVIVGQGTPKSLLTEDFIRHVYEVDTTVITDQQNKLHILY